jgi:hypothetical protein
MISLEDSDIARIVKNAATVEPATFDVKTTCKKLCK